ncbi:MAG TPA: DUF3592 domain-containing protein [Bryobacteraceae bacterium]|nr:DUF3592 domain-containing protein [Bryobacteraceae bacterium]
MTYIPQELMRSSPRQVELTGTGRFMVVLAFLIAVGGTVGGAYLYDAASRDAVRAGNLKAEGLATQAEILRVETTSGKNKKTVAHYRYFVDGHPYESRVTLPRRDRSRFQTGEFVSVRYLPSEPAFNAMEDYAPRTTPLAAAIAVPAVGAVIALIIVLVFRKQRRFLSEGRPSLARVYKVEKRWTGKHRTNRVHYQYTDLSGAMQTGSYDKNWSPPQPGTEFVVLYDREKPHRSMRYPMSLVTVSGL